MWRIVIGVSLVPAFAMLYQHLTLPESTRFLALQKLKNASAKEEGDAIAELKRAQLREETQLGNLAARPSDVEKAGDKSSDSDSEPLSSPLSSSVEDEMTAPPEVLTKKKVHFLGECCPVCLCMRTRLIGAASIEFVKYFSK